MNASTLLIFIATALIGGSTAALVKLVVFQFGPIPQLFLRALFAALLLLPFLFKQKRLYEKKKFASVMLVSLLAAANGLFFAFGIGHTSVIMGQLIYTPTAIIVAILAWLFLKEKLTKNQIIGLFFTIAGISILIMGSLKTKDVFSFGTPFGNLLIIAGLLSWSSYVVFSKKLSEVFSPLEITFFNFLVTTSISFLILPFSLNTFNFEKVTLVGVFALISLTVFSTVLFFFFYQILIKRTSAFISSLVLYLNAVFAAGAGIIFYNEKLNVSLIIGATMIIIGVIVSTYKKSKY